MSLEFGSFVVEELIISTSGHDNDEPTVHHPQKLQTYYV